MLKKVLKNGLLLVFALLCIVYPIYILIVRPGFFHGPFSAASNHAMYQELVIWLLVMLIGLRWKNLNWIYAVVIVFSYAHVMLLPMTLAIGYTLLTYLMGVYICEKLKWHSKGNIQLGAYFWGIVVLTILYAVLSLMRIGSIRNLRIVDALLLILFGVWFLKRQSTPLQTWWKKNTVSANVYMKAAVVVCFVFLMIGRANVSVDVDSAWYGLRSAYVLDNQIGIFEDLKLVGCVYTYPKGYEVYQLPLSGLPSYGYVYAGNIVMAIMVLLVVYKIARLFMNSEQSMWVMIMVAAIPGIMNMGITAKPDIMTLLIQLLQVYYSILLLQKREALYLGLVGATYIYAQSLKPTAVMFSTTLVIALLFVIIVYRVKVGWNKNSLILWIVSGIDLAFIWYRTYLLTGIPATSVWGRLFRMLGMQEKYPYASGQISQFRPGGLFSQEVIQGTLTRMKEFFFAPNSADTDHIILAWGSSLCIFFVVIALAGALVNVRHTVAILKRNAVACFLGLLLVGEFVGCVLCLWVLSKPDGNYFMLFYCIAAMVGAIYLQRILIQQKVFVSNMVYLIFILFIPTNIVLTGCGNWAWAGAFNPIDWVNRGFANHEQDTKRAWKAQGCDKIYDIMVADRSNKVLGYAIHPNVELIPCVMESEQDVSFWGNAALTATTENFREFVEYENYDYIFISNEYITSESGAYSYMDDLIDAGMVKNVVTENGFVLLEMGTPDAPHSKEEMKQQYHSVWEEETEE